MDNPYNGNMPWGLAMLVMAVGILASIYFLVSQGKSDRLDINRTVITKSE